MLLRLDYQPALELLSRASRSDVAEKDTQCLSPQWALGGREGWGCGWGWEAASHPRDTEPLTLKDKSKHVRAGGGCAVYQLACADCTGGLLAGVSPHPSCDSSAPDRGPRHLKPCGNQQHSSKQPDLSVGELWCQGAGNRANFKWSQGTGNMWY